MGSQPGHSGGKNGMQFSSPIQEWSSHTSSDDKHDLYAVENIMDLKLIGELQCRQAFGTSCRPCWNPSNAGSGKVNIK